MGVELSPHGQSGTDTWACQVLTGQCPVLGHWDSGHTPDSGCFPSDHQGSMANTFAEVVIKRPQRPKEEITSSGRRTVSRSLGPARPRWRRQRQHATSMQAGPKCANLYKLRTTGFAMSCPVAGSMSATACRCMIWCTNLVEMICDGTHYGARSRTASTWVSCSS